MLRIGSRGSQLALWQARHVQSRLATCGLHSEIVVIRTSGDRILDAALASFGGKGLFTREIDDALLNKTIDLAVHSLKDVPAELPDGLILAAVLEREDARDVLLASKPYTVQSLPRGARVGTGSLRRTAQVLHLRPDVSVLPLRGNVDTRLRRLAQADFDALLLAAAGVKRLDKTESIVEWIAPELICPAIGQGALAIACRDDDSVTRETVASLHEPLTADAVNCERAVLRCLGGGCQAPIAAHARCTERELQVRALVASPDGRELIEAESSGSREQSTDLGYSVGEELLKRGADRILQAIYAQTVPVPEIP